MSGVNLLPTKYINYSDNFQFVKLNPFYRAVLRYGMRLCIYSHAKSRESNDSRLFLYSRLFFISIFILSRSSNRYIPFL